MLEYWQTNLLVFSFLLNLPCLLVNCQIIQALKIISRCRLPKLAILSMAYSLPVSLHL
jgi:hypothetical protein